MKKVLILAGSLREGSFNKLLAKGVKENFSDIFNFEIFSNFEKFHIIMQMISKKMVFQIL